MIYMRYFNHTRYRLRSLLPIAVIIALVLTGCSSIGNTPGGNPSGQQDTKKIEIDGAYSKPEEVAEYIHTYHKLPGNYLTKKQAIALGWESSKGNLWDVTDKMIIGGDVFGNREGKLPDADVRVWYECDVNYSGGYRGKERIVYSSDGLIYYTKDHYETFEEMKIGGK